MNQKNLWKYLAALVFVFLTFCTISNAYGSGFAIYTQGASALGQADAVIAHADDPSAIFFNSKLSLGIYTGKGYFLSMETPSLVDA